MKNSLLIQNYIDNYRWLQKKGLAHHDIVIEKLADPETVINKKKYICFCSNNYLGLSKRPEVIKAAQNALIKHGIGTCESRRLGGNLDVLEKLEDTISKYKNSEDTITFATGLMANVGAISALTDIDFYTKLFYGKTFKKNHPETLIVGDELNHWSIRMGIKLSRANFIKYRHNDVNHLSDILKNNKNKILFIITDSVFSMDGDIAHLDKISELSQKYRAAVMIDDAHGTGVWGKTGRGIAEHFSVSDKIEIKMGTLSKAFGGLGGFVSAKKEVVDMMKINASTYYFTSGLPADEAAGLIETIKIADKEPRLRKQLWKNVDRFLTGLIKIGANVPHRYSQIIPVIIGNEKKAFEIESYLYKNGIICNAVGGPAVARGNERIRCTINATHTENQIDYFIDVFDDIIKKFKLQKFKVSESEFQTFKNSAADYIKKFLE